MLNWKLIAVDRTVWAETPLGMRRVADCNLSGIDYEDRDRFAVLFAAAPDLLAALKAVSEQIDPLSPVPELSRPEVLQMVRAAIARAECK